MLARGVDAELLTADSGGATGAHSRPATAPMNPVELIKRKRDGSRLTDDEIRSFIAEFVDGRVADYQMSAWLMAALLRGARRSRDPWL